MKNGPVLAVLLSLLSLPMGHHCLAQTTNGTQDSDTQIVPPIIAEYETTNVQPFGGANALERTQTGNFYRDSMGRTRVEQGTIVTISDPVARVGFLLDVTSKVAKRVVWGRNQNIGVSASRTQGYGEGSPLGTQTIEGVQCTGTKFTSTVPANSALGNRLPIQQATEIWMSDDLKLQILLVTENELTGKTSYRYKNVQTKAPDPTLFQVPQGYQIVDASRVAR